MVAENGYSVSVKDLEGSIEGVHISAVVLAYRFGIAKYHKNSGVQGACGMILRRWQNQRCGIRAFAHSRIVPVLKSLSGAKEATPSCS